MYAGHIEHLHSFIHPLTHSANSTSQGTYWKTRQAPRDHVFWPPCLRVSLPQEDYLPQPGPGRDMCSSFVDCCHHSGSFLTLLSALCLQHWISRPGPRECLLTESIPLSSPARLISLSTSPYGACLPHSILRAGVPGPVSEACRGLTSDWHASGFNSRVYKWFVFLKKLRERIFSVS